MAAFELARMKQMQAWIGLRGGDNVSELSGVPAEKMKLRDVRFRPVQEQRVNHTRWCVLRQPNASMAQLAGMSTDAFEDYYFRVCNLDYSKMSRAMDALVALMERTEHVRLTGPGTDLAFSIAELPAVRGRRGLVRRPRDPEGRPVRRAGARGAEPGPARVGSRARPAVREAPRPAARGTMPPCAAASPSPPRCPRSSRSR